MTPTSPDSSSPPPPPIPPDEQAAQLHAQASRYFRRERGSAEATIRGWAAMAEIRRSAAFHALGAADFYAYCRDQQGLTSRPYIQRCLPIGALPLALFKDCTVPVEALQQACSFGPLTLRVLARATRNRLDGSGKLLIEACELMASIKDDREAAKRLHGVLVLGQALAPVRKDEPEGAQEEEEEESADELTEQISSNLADTQALALALRLRVDSGDRIGARRKARLRAQVLGSEALLVSLAELAAKGSPGRPGTERRRAARAAADPDEADESASAMAAGRADSAADASACAGDPSGSAAGSDDGVDDDDGEGDGDDSDADGDDQADGDADVDDGDGDGDSDGDGDGDGDGDADDDDDDHADSDSDADDDDHADSDSDADDDDHDADAAAGGATEVMDAPAVDTPQPQPEERPPEPAAAASVPAADAPAPDPHAAVLPSRRRPDVWRRGDVAFPIPYPLYHRPGAAPLSDVDRMAASTIALAGAGCSAAAFITDQRSGALYQPLDLILVSRYYNAVFDAGEFSRVLHEVLQPGADLGQQQLGPAYRAAAAQALRNPPRPTTRAEAAVFKARLASADPSAALPSTLEDPQGWQPLMPLRPHPAWDHDALPFLPGPADPPLWDWALASCGDFLGLDEHPGATLAMLRYIGVVNALHPLLNRLVTFLDTQGSATLEPRLAFQALFAMSEMVFHSQTYLFKDEADQGAAEETRRAALRASRRAECDARVVVLGEPRRPALYATIGHDAQDRLLAVTAETPQLVIIVGNTGYGKSHLMHVLAEGVTLNLPGLNTLTSPQRTIRFEADYNQGATRRQMLSGYQPNNDPLQLEALRRHYDHRSIGNEAFTGGTLLCLPDSVAGLHKELAPLVERGLKILPAVCGAGDVGMVGYRSLLGPAHGSGADKPLYMSRVEAMISNLGEGVTPLRLRQEIERSRLDGRVKEALCRQLQLIASLISDGAPLSDVLLEPEPCFVLLESCQLSPDVILPYQSVLAGALCRPLSDGTHPHRWLFVDEYNKYSGNAVINERSREAGQERRHHPCSWVVNGQRPSGMDAGFMGQATIFVCFRMSSRKEIRVVKDRCGALNEVPDEVFMNLQHGQCIVAALQATSEDSVFGVKVRPAVSHAGGETLRVTRLEE